MINFNLILTMKRLVKQVLALTTMITILWKRLNKILQIIKELMSLEAQ